jgi:ATP-dependent DNA helicase Q1
MSRIEYQSSVSKRAVPSSSTATAASAEPSYLATKHALDVQIANLEAEISGYDEEIKQMKALRAIRVNEREKLVEQRQHHHHHHYSRAQKEKGKERAQDGIDYTFDGFDWSHELEAQMRKVFGINSFRLCQRG